MTRWPRLLIVVLALAVAGSADARDDKKNDPEAVARQALTDAAAKEAAGDIDGAIAALDDVAGQPGAAAGEAALKVGQLREDRGELDLAIDAYRAAAEKLSGPLKGEALGRLSVVEASRQVGDSNASAAAAVAADPEGVWPTIAQSHRLVGEGKTAEGVALAEKAVTAGGGGAALSALGHAREAAGDVAGAEEAFRKAMAEDPHRLGPVIGLAGVLRRTGRAGEAEPLLARVIEASPGAIGAYKEMARTRIALGRAQEALGDAATAAAMAEGDTDAQNLVMEVKVARALEELGKGNAALAVQDLTQLRDQNPDSAEVRFGLGRAQIARRDAAGAITELQKAVELDPSRAEAQYQLGWVQLMMKGDAAGAVGPLQKAAELEPANLSYLTSLGTALAGAQQFDAAIDTLTKVTAMPGYEKAEGFASLGQAYVGAKKYKDAAAALEKATELAPENNQAWAMLGWAYFGLKDADKFKAAAGKARSLGYSEPTLLQYLKRVEGGEPIK